MAEEVSSIGVRLTLDASNFSAGMERAQGDLKAFSTQAAEAGKLPGAGGSPPGSSGARKMPVDVTLSVTDASITALRKRVQAGLGNIPVTISPTFATTGRWSMQNVMGAMLSGQYGISPSQGRIAATSAMERAMGSMPIKKAAMGGTVPANRPVIVGDGGRPEVIVPKTTSIIHPSVSDFYRKQDALRRQEVTLVLLERQRQQRHERQMQRHGGGLARAMAGKFRAVAPESFSEAISSARSVVRPSGRSVGETVYQYPLDEYAKMRTFLSRDRLSGYALKPSGQDQDLVSVFNVGGRGMGKSAVRSAVQRGATTLDAFDEISPTFAIGKTDPRDVQKNLPNFYRKFGFREVGRDPWNPDYAPEGWAGGEPDVVYMRRQLASLKRRMGGGRGCGFCGGGHVSAAHRQGGGKVAGSTDLAKYGPQSVLEQNIWDVVGQMSPKDVHIGKVWYGTANKITREAAALTGYGDLDRALATVAATSPQMVFASNIAHATAMMKGATTGQYPTKSEADALLGQVKQWADTHLGPGNVKVPKGVMGLPRMQATGGPGGGEKAWRILTTQNPILDILSGPKVVPFFKNLSGDLSELTLDSLAAQIATGGAYKQSPTSGVFRDAMDAAYREVHRSLPGGLKKQLPTIAQLQAATWVRWRGAGMQAGGEVSEFEAKAHRMFGTTEDPMKAGWLGPSGKYLDFSAQGSGMYQKLHMGPMYEMAGPSGKKLLRTIPHAAARRLFGQQFGESVYPRMMDQGFMRIAGFSPAHAALQMSSPLTGRQRSRMLADLKDYDVEQLTLDLDALKTGHPKGSFSSLLAYDRGSAARILQQASEFAGMDVSKLPTKGVPNWVPNLAMIKGEVNLAKILGRAGGGQSPKGLYIVGEIGEELFVPDRLAHMIPKRVMDQIPKAQGGMQVIGTKRDHELGGELFAPPEDGIIIPHRLMDQIPKAAEGLRTDLYATTRDLGTGRIASNQRVGEGGPLPVNVMNWPAGLQQGATAAAPAGATTARAPRARRAGALAAAPLAGAADEDGPLATVPGETAQQRTIRLNRFGVEPLSMVGPLPGQFEPYTPGRAGEQAAPGGPRAALNKYGVVPIEMVESFPGPFQRLTERPKSPTPPKPPKPPRPLPVNKFGVTPIKMTAGLPGPSSSLATRPGATGLSPEAEEQFASLEQGLITAGQATSTRTPQGLIAALSSTFFGGGRARDVERIATQRTALRELKTIQSTLDPIELGKYQSALDKVTMTRGREREEAQKSVRTLEEQNRQLPKWRDAQEKFAKSQQQGLPGLGSGLMQLGKVVAGIQIYSTLIEGVGFAMSAAHPAIAKSVDQLMGFTAQSEATTTALAKQTREQQGNLVATTNLWRSQQNLGGGLGDLITETLAPTVAVKAGAEVAGNIEAGIEAALGTRREGAPVGTFGGFGGALGGPFFAELMGGGKGVMEQMAGAVGKLTPSPVFGTGKPSWDPLGGKGFNLTDTGLVPGAPDIFGGGTRGAAPVQLRQDFGRDELQQSLLDWQVDTMNEAMKRGRVSPAFVGQEKENVPRQDVSFISTDDRKLIERGMEVAPTTELLKLAKDGVILVREDQEGRQRLLGPRAQLKAATTLGAGLGMQDPKLWATEMFRQMDAQGIGAARLEQRQLDIQQPFELWQRITQQPLIQPGAGFFGPGGRAPGVGGRFSGLLNRAEGYQEEIRGIAAEGLAEQRAAIIEADLPPSVPGGPSALAQFNEATTEATKLSGAIENMTEKMLDAQRVASNASWANQIRIAERSLGDALGMLGRAGGTRLGFLEREQFMVSRASQQLGLQSQSIGLVQQGLSLALQARQIATNLAVAQFQAPGETGEERAARQKEAIIRAQIEQRQLGLSQQQHGIAEQQLPLATRQFAIAGQIWSINAHRAAVDAQKSIAVMQLARNAEGRAIASQAAIAGAAEAAGHWLRRANTIAARAEGKHSQAIQTTVDGIISLGQAANVVTKALYEAIGMEQPGTGGSRGGSRGGSSRGSGGRTGRTSGRTDDDWSPHDLGGATGLLGMTAGATSLLVGEAGQETVAILRNPRMGSLGGGGGRGSPTVINIQINSPNVRGDDDVDRLAHKVARAVEAAISRKGQLLGLRRPSY